MKTVNPFGNFFANGVTSYTPSWHDKKVHAAKVTVSKEIAAWNYAVDEKRKAKQARKLPRFGNPQRSNP